MKKTNILRLFALAIASGTLLMACDKDDAPSLSPKVQKLVAKNWKVQSINVKLPNDADSNVLKACTSDDIIQLTTSGFDFQDGATRCDSTAFFYAKGSWAINETTDSIHLNASSPAKYVSWKIVTLNDSVLKVTLTDSSNVARKLVKTIAFKH
ncbi:hypothetical protein [Ferruginibacter sp. HRS2-29]|uniref:hypothetical protein n=1 Tax=Ferruginibacter sp. HRS2-29 TaxID=2487334 RepID=UPI0020CF987B|nr:hypothetical protein [Ferruginibacter sp. HRS2-29]MCP9751599.1 hypothetical protein [Ferruginibacter sp. HRS2-29]